MDMINEQLQKKIDRAIRLLQGVQNGYDGEIEVAYSGGKDSDVILQLAKESGIRYRAIHKSTTIDPPGTIAHVKEMGVEILRPKISFFDLVAKKGLPSRFYRFCCEQLKEYKVCNKAIIGVRKAESSKRATIYKEPTECRYYGEKKEENHVEAIYPILEWTDEDVHDFIIDRKLKLAPIYYNSGGGKSTYRNAWAVCAAHSPHSASVSRTSRRNRAWLAVICAPASGFGTHIPTHTFKTDMPTFTNGLLVTCSSFVKKTGRKQTTRCLESQTGRNFLKGNLALI